MKKIIIHLGPPKTATTSLQYFFQKIDFKSMNALYIGVLQPRNKKNLKAHNAIADKILSFVKNPDKKNILKRKIF